MTVRPPNPPMRSLLLATLVAARWRLQPLHGRGRRDRGDAGRGPDPGPQSGQAEHRVHDGRLRQHGMGFPAGLRRVGGLRHRALPRRHPVRRRDVAPGGRLHVQPVRSSGQERELQRRVLRSPALYRPGKKADGTDLPCEGSDTTCGAPWTAVYTNGFAGYPGANTGGTIDLTTGYPDTVWCWKTGPTAPGEADRRRQRLGVPPQRPHLQRRDGERKHDAGDRRRLQLPEHVGHVLGAREVQVRQPASRSTAHPYYYTISQVQFCSAKDAAGWGTSPCVSQWDPTTYKYVRYGTGAATFDPQAFTRVDIKSVGVPRQRRRPRPIPAAARTRRRWPISPTGTRSTARGSCR